MPFLLRRNRLGRWLARQTWRLNFGRNRFEYANRERLSAARLATHSTWTLLRLALPSVVFAVLAVVVLVASELAYEVLSPRLGMRVTSLPDVDGNTYLTVMATVATAAAAILALFFAAVSVVASTTYARVPSEIRSLIAQDDLNRRYLRLLAHTAATAALGLGLFAGGGPPSLVLLTYVVVLASVSLLAFFPLGVRTFALFDPGQLVGYPLRSFVRALRTVTSEGRRWQDQSFQNHARKIAERQLTLLEDLVTMAVNDDRPRNNAVLTIVDSVHHLTRHYAGHKGRIPSDSFWFPRRAQFRRWQEASSSVTGIALQTGTAPSPEPVPDPGFVETRCIAVTSRCLNHLLSRKSGDDVVTLLMQVNATATRCASLFEQADAMRLVESVRAPVLEYLKDTDCDDAPLTHLQIIDIVCVAALAPVLNTSLALTDRSAQSHVALSQPLLAQRHRGLYSERRPRHVLQDAEDLSRRLDFERRTEGQIRTRPWYLRQMIAFAYADVIREVIMNIANTVEREFVSPAAELIDAKRALWAGAWLQRGIEACHKATTQIQSLEEAYAELKGFHVTELSWHPSGGADGLAGVAAHRRKIITLLAAIVPDLCRRSSDDQLPDLLGQTRAQIAEELCSVMARGEERGFAELFTSYFDATLAVYQHFAEIAQQPGKADYIRASMDVMVDVLDVSGLAVLFTELDGTQFGRIVKGAWDTYLNACPNKRQVIVAWLGAIEMKLKLPVFSPSAMQRQKWGQRFAQAMVDRGIDVDRHYYNPSFDWAEYQAHRSAVIESLHVHLGHLTNPHVYFAALYLAPQCGDGTELPSIVRECIKSIEKAANRQRKAADARAAKKNRRE